MKGSEKRGLQKPRGNFVWGESKKSDTVPFPLSANCQNQLENAKRKWRGDGVWKDLHNWPFVSLTLWPRQSHPQRCGSERWSRLGRMCQPAKQLHFSKLFCTKQFVLRDWSNEPDTGTKCWMSLEISSGLLEMEKRHRALLAHSPYRMVLPNWLSWV